MRISDWSSDVCSSDLTQQGDMQKALAEANSLAITAQTRPERAQAEISSSQTRPQQINTTLKNGKEDRQSVVEGKRVSVSVDLGGRRIINNNNYHQSNTVY